MSWGLKTFEICNSFTEAWENQVKRDSCDVLSNGSCEWSWAASDGIAMQCDIFTQRHYRSSRECQNPSSEMLAILNWLRRTIVLPTKAWPLIEPMVWVWLAKLWSLARMTWSRSWKLLVVIGWSIILTAGCRERILFWTVITDEYPLPTVYSKSYADSLWE